MNDIHDIPEPVTEIELQKLQRDICPDCDSQNGFDNGPRGGAGRNIFCVSCGQGFNVAYPRCVMMGERIHKRDIRR